MKRWVLQHRPFDWRSPKTLVGAAGLLACGYVAYRIVKSKRPAQEALKDGQAVALGTSEGLTGKTARVLVDLSVWGSGSHDTSQKFLKTASRAVMQYMKEHAESGAKLAAAGATAYGAAHVAVYCASDWRKLVPLADRTERDRRLKAPPFTSADYEALLRRLEANVEVWKPRVTAEVPFSFCGDAPLSMWVYLGAATARSSITAGPTSSEHNQLIVGFPDSGDAHTAFTADVQGDGNNIVLFVTTNPRNALTVEQQDQIIGALNGPAQIICVRPAAPLRARSATEMAGICRGAQDALLEALVSLPDHAPQCAVVTVGPAQLGLAVGRALTTMVDVAQRPEEVITFELYADPASAEAPLRPSELQYVRALSWRG